MKSSFDGVRLFETPRFDDDRGWFLPALSDRVHRKHGVAQGWAEMNISHSRAGVIRGLHFQDPNPQAKLISVLDGSIWDVVVDLRPHSPTFLRWEAYELDAGGVSQIYLPAGFAHGFATPHHPATIAYLASAPYHPDHQRVLSWDDPELAIDWPLTQPILSRRDRAARPLAAVRATLRSPHPIGS